MFQRKQWKQAPTVVAMALVMTAIVTSAARGSEDAPRSLEEAVKGAVEAWSEFATTGSLSLVRTAFALDGPQYRQFQIEANDGGAEPNGGAFEMEIRDLRLRREGSTTSTVWTRIEVGRTGFIPEVVSWDFDLINDDGRWLVWTVVPAETPLSEVSMVEPSSKSASARPATTHVAPRTTQEPEVARVPTSDPVVNAGHSSLAASTRGVRIPALSAWIIVITLVGVAVAGYMAPRIDRRQG